MIAGPAGDAWADAVRTPLAGDASARRYTRLSRPGATAVLMEDPAGDIAPFLRAAHHFHGLGLSVPEILASDTRRGLILMEDLGDAIFARRIAADPAREVPLMAAATDLLATLHAQPAPDWAAPYGPEEMAAFLAPLWEHHVADPDPAAVVDLTATLTDLLFAHARQTDVLLHRDYHAENLVWLPARQGIARVGLLDFQDALAGHRAYDLASLLQDARRDVSPEVEAAMIARYTAATGQEPGDFRTAYALQSLQRHLRILGIFSRLAATRGKPGYLNLVPRVRALIRRCLADPVTRPLHAHLSALGVAG